MNRYYTHLHTLCVVHDVILRIDPGSVDALLQTPDGRVPVGGYALPDLRAVVCPDVASSAQYAIVLHEMGHICHDRPRPGCVSAFQIVTYLDAMQCLEEEDHAWEWARAHAMEWTPSMDAAHVHGRESYRTRVISMVKASMGLRTAAHSLKNWRP